VGTSCEHHRQSNECVSGAHPHLILLAHPQIAALVNHQGTKFRGCTLDGITNSRQNVLTWCSENGVMNQQALCAGGLCATQVKQRAFRPLSVDGTLSGAYASWISICRERRPGAPYTPDARCACLPACNSHT